MSVVATPRVKLCGLRRPQDVEAANEAWPDYVGFVVDFPRSRRNVPASELAALSRLVRPEIRRVGVFVNEPVEAIAELFDSGAIDVVQLHGSEDEDYLSRLRATCGVPVIQAFRMRGAKDVERAMASTAELVLLDNGQGTGHTFDWSLARDVRRPYMLAGGLGPENVAQAIRSVHPWGVDMSGGVETEGTKDPIKMRAAVAAAKGAI